MNISTVASAYVGATPMRGVSGASSYVPTEASSTDALVVQMRSDIKQNSQDFKALKTAFNSNDLAGATQAFTTLQQDIQKASQAAGGKGPFAANSPIGKDFQALGDALKSGDVSAAKQAFATFTQDIKSAGRTARAGHHTAAKDGDADDGAQSPAIMAANATAPSQAIGSVLNTTAKGKGYF